MIGDTVSGFTRIVAHAKITKVEVLKPKVRIDFFSAESFGVNVPPRCDRCKTCKHCRFEIHQLSISEQKELEVIRNNLKLDPISNKWSTEDPYTCDPSILKDNRAQASSLLERTERRLSRNNDIKEEYRKQFRDFVSRGIFKEISEKEYMEYAGPVSYISHHEVFKEDSASTPVRIVLNSSLKFNGISINDIMMKGPNSLSNLFAIQLRFRTQPCALVGDIQKMYNSIQTTVKERHLRRLIWRDMKVNEPPKIYGTETVMFGDKPAAAISAVAILQTAEIFSNINEKAA